MMPTKPTHILDKVETMGGSWVLSLSPVTKVEIINGCYEVRPISEDWDKDPGFNETLYYHMLNIGFSTLEEEAE